MKNKVPVNNYLCAGFGRMPNFVTLSFSLCINTLTLGYYNDPVRTGEAFVHDVTRVS